MSRIQRLRPALLLLSLSVALAGCGPVRQDRTIPWSDDGRLAAVQHDGAGIFLTGPDGQPTREIFRPGPEVLVSSSPLWAPAGKRLVFTTARPVGAPPARRPDADTPAEGDWYRPRPVLCR